MYVLEVLSLILCLAFGSVAYVSLAENDIRFHAKFLGSYSSLYFCFLSPIILMLLEESLLHIYWLIPLLFFGGRKFDAFIILLYNKTSELFFKEYIKKNHLTFLESTDIMVLKFFLLNGYVRIIIQCIFIYNLIYVITFDEINNLLVFIAMSHSAFSAYLISRNSEYSSRVSGIYILGIYLIIWIFLQSSYPPDIKSKALIESLIFINLLNIIVFFVYNDRKMVSNYFYKKIQAFQKNQARLKMKKIDDDLNDYILAFSCALDLKLIFEYKWERLDFFSDKSNDLHQAKEIRLKNLKEYINAKLSLPVNKSLKKLFKTWEKYPFYKLHIPV